MTEASWGEAGSPEINWRMSAALENVPRGDQDLAEVTSLGGAVRAWQALDPSRQADAILTPEQPLLIDGVAMSEFVGPGIEALVGRLPEFGLTEATNDDAEDQAG